MGSVIITFSISNKKISKPNQRVKSQMPLTQDSQTTFKPNLTCICLSARARNIMSNPNEIPCTTNLEKKSTKKVISLHLKDFLSLAITQNGEKLFQQLL